MTERNYPTTMTVRELIDVIRSEAVDFDDYVVIGRSENGQESDIEPFATPYDHSRKILILQLSSRVKKDGGV